ncbi:phosphoribosylglycinamide formyltransferase [Armatimonas sp.]|uniref:phosphoribosylglycinamide formyltransferase n=1 Tax=Armatimonas sp. TaxID=1872638 RepID=UPI00286CADCC|nr:phosphoribosylglycinamide formyltransferase [Armatimonas sp.]
MTEIKPLRLAVFVGVRGRGSNLMAIHSATQDGRLSGEVALVIGTKPDAPALLRAQEAGIPVAVIAPGDSYEAQLLATLTKAHVNTIALAGYLRKLPEAVVEHFRNRIVNVHPALLPAFGGKGMYGHHVHEAVVAYGCKVSGCTVHFVDSEYDTGPIVLQRTVPVLDTDTPETLAARILPEEHAAYIEALQLLAEGRILLEGRRVVITSGSPRS